MAASISALFNPTPLVNVARYSALVGGVTFGIYHRHALQKDADKAHLATIKAHRQELVSQAQAKWAELHPAPKSTSGSYFVFHVGGLPNHFDDAVADDIAGC